MAFSDGKCVDCAYEFGTYGEKYGCSKCLKAPLCIVCVFRDHDNCGTFPIDVEIKRLTNEMTHWMINTAEPNLSMISTQRDKLRQAASEIQAVVPKPASEPSSEFTKDLEKYLNETLDLLKQGDEIADGCEQIREFCQLLLSYASQKPTPQMTIDRFLQGKKTFKQVETIYDQFYDYVDSGQVEDFLKMKAILKPSLKNE